MNDIYEGTWELKTLASEQEESETNWLLGYFVKQNEDMSESPTQITVVTAGDPSYQYCSQDFLRNFWDSEDDFFTEDQKIVTFIYGWTSIFVSAAGILWFVFSGSLGIRRLYRGSYKEVCL